MARPVGRFDKKKLECYSWVKLLTKPKCWASNGYLAAKMGCSTRQISRYMRALEKEGKIIRQQYRYSVSGNLKTKRHVYLKTASPWMPTLFSPPNRFQGYSRKVVKMCAKVEPPPELSPAVKEMNARLDKLIAQMKSHERPPATLEQRVRQDYLNATRPKRAGVIFSAATQAIIDKLPPESQ